MLTKIVLMRQIKKLSSLVKSALTRKRKNAQGSFDIYSDLNFDEVNSQAHSLADRIEGGFEELAHILLEYESYEVVVDEISRTLDLLRNLEENEAYFKLRIGAVTTFLPRNQPLYALACFVIIPSLMASEVSFRIPHSMRHFFPKLLAFLDIYSRFPNIRVSSHQRTEFLQERSSLLVNPETKETKPLTDVVIFTGTPVHAEQLRFVFDQRTLFITNGSGHNPVVVSKDSDLHTAIDAVLTLQLYNQGQDCAAPNAVLVHSDIYTDFLRTLRDEIRTVKVGDYRDRRCRVGPISDPKDLVRIQDFLIDNREWLDPTTPGIIRAYDAILEPTIICKPLKEGGNYDEIFAPAIFLQKYEKDSDLAQYFETTRYAQNAMYVTTFGKSAYTDALSNREIDGKVLHPESTLLHNTHLHAYGIERGTQPYGGNGYGASNLSILGKIYAKPTLPQRDIYEWVAKPIIDENSIATRKLSLLRFTETLQKDIPKLMKMKSTETAERVTGFVLGSSYVDLETLNQDDRRYVPLTEESLHQLLDAPNTSYIAKMSLLDLEQVRSLRAMLKEPNTLSLEEFSTALYACATEPEMSNTQKRAKQQQFFLNLYQLMFGKTSGPRLAQFLLEVDRERVCALLDV